MKSFQAPSRKKHIIHKDIVQLDVDTDTSQPKIESSKTDKKEKKKSKESSDKKSKKDKKDKKKKSKHT